MGIEVCRLCRDCSNKITENNLSKQPLYEFEDNSNYLLNTTINNIDIYRNTIVDKITEIKIKNNIKKIQKAFRIFQGKKNDSNQIFKEYSEIPTSEYITYLNDNDLDVNLAPERNCIYLGTKYKNKKDGLGLEIFSKTKSKYFGIFRNGKRVQLGKFSIDNKHKRYYYNGYIKGIYAYGYGWFIDYQTFSSYEGMWEKSMKNGCGIEMHEDKSEYRGMFLNGKKDGIGYYKWRDGSLYQGEWKDNKINGYGLYIFTDGSIYRGEWKENKRDGIGEFSHIGIKTYIGFFKKDNREGFGMLIWHQENKAFIGFWKNNKQEGSGKFLSNNNIKYGIWKEGRIFEKISNKMEFNKRLTDNEIRYLSYLQIDDYNVIKQLVNKYITMEDNNDNDEDYSEKNNLS